ncbi:MAG: hypothetical protein AAF340_10160 [Pseudomonadota bacterium]
MSGLKRIKLASANELSNWLAKAPASLSNAMLVTPVSPSKGNDTSRDQVQSLLSAHGWVSDQRYTLGAGGLGHVIRRSGT